jgi:hypothetical protein
MNTEIGTEIGSEVIAQAQAAAIKLKSELLTRIVGQRRAFRCNCGAIHTPESEVVDISLPTYPELLALSMHWTAELRALGNPHGTDYDDLCNISEFIAWKELFFQFRAVFEPLGMPTSHLPAMNDDLEGFSGSGETAVLLPGKPLYVRPVGDVSKSFWQAAAILINRNPPEYEPADLLACVIDPFANFSSISYPEYYPLAPMAFAAHPFNVLAPLWICAVRSVDAAAGSAIVEPYAGTEFFQFEEGRRD